MKSNFTKIILVLVVPAILGITAAQPLAWGEYYWMKTFGGVANNKAASVQQTKDGGYILTGSYLSPGKGQLVYLLKTDTNGNELWSRTFEGTGDDCGSSVQQTNDGGYIVAGSWGRGDPSIILIKTDSDGNELWMNTFGNGYGTSVQQTDDGGYILAGARYIDLPAPFGVDYDVLLIKTDADGNELWRETWGETNDDFGRSVQQTKDGGYIIAGTFLIKTDANGNELWIKNIGGRSVQQTTDGGYIIAGKTGTVGKYSLYLIKIDVDGNEVWSKTWPGWGWSVRQTIDGGYIVAGTAAPDAAGNGQVLLLYYSEFDPNQPPEAICQDVTVSTEPETCNADASVDDGSNDPDGDEITLEQMPPGPYSSGDTEVTLTVTDDKGASDTCDATVTVVDEEAPIISSVTANPNKLWPPNHKMVPVVLAVDATDNCDSEPICQIISVASNEPVNGLEDGNTAPDWVFSGDLTVKLRAESFGTGSGRIYTITVECADSSGNSSTDTATVTVPHDKGKKNNKK
jgi:putative pyrroloquinoline-quinone binding quinoprotein